MVLEPKFATNSIAYHGLGVSFFACFIRCPCRRSTETVSIDYLHTQLSYVCFVTSSLVGVAVWSAVSLLSCCRFRMLPGTTKSQVLVVHFLQYLWPFCQSVYIGQARSQVSSALQTTIRTCQAQNLKVFGAFRKKLSTQPKISQNLIGFSI